MRLIPLAPVLLLALAPMAAWAEEQLSPEEFRRFAEGYTLYFSREGQEAGSESFDADGSVTWRSPDGTCIEGVWQPRGQDLCFFYGAPEVECWQLLRDDKGLKVRQLGEAEEDEIVTFRIERRDRRPLLCGAPSVGI